MAITFFSFFVMHRPLPRTSTGKRDFPPSPYGNQSRLGLMCLLRCGWPRVSQALICSVGSGANNSEFRPPQTGVCRDVKGNEEVNNFDRVRFKATPFVCDLWFNGDPVWGLPCLTLDTVCRPNRWKLPLPGCVFFTYTGMSLFAATCNMNNID